jgi:hypothetical protein
VKILYPTEAQTPTPVIQPVGSPYTNYATMAEGKKNKRLVRRNQVRCGMLKVRRRERDDIKSHRTYDIRPKQTQYQLS